MKGFVPYGVSSSTVDQPWGLKIYAFHWGSASIIVAASNIALLRLFIIACHDWRPHNPVWGGKMSRGVMNSSWTPYTMAEVTIVDFC